MKKTQFFSGESTEALQLGVNTWLSEHKNIDILRSGMGVASGASQAGYSFYILYEDSGPEQMVAVSESVQNEVILPDPDGQLQ